MHSKKWILSEPYSLPDLGPCLIRLDAV
jgi:hypothetical protein